MKNLHYFANIKPQKEGCMFCESQYQSDFNNLCEAESFGQLLRREGKVTPLIGKVVNLNILKLAFLGRIKIKEIISKHDLGFELRRKRATRMKSDDVKITND